MANLSIIDTGYLRADVQGSSQATQANSGNPINLKAVDITYDFTGNVDTEPIINSNDISKVGFGSVNTPKIVVSGILDRNSSNDMNLMKELKLLVKTYGIKLLYYSSTTDGYRDVTDSLGTENSDDWHKTTFFSGVSTPHLHVKIVGFRIAQKGTSQLRYTLEFVETE